MTYRFHSIYFDDAPKQGRALDIFEPGEVRQEIALFFVHGGGWHAGSRSHMHQLMYAFTRQGFICASTDYRLAGVTAFDQVSDVRQGYDLFQAHLRDAQRPARVMTFGSSAGAHLALLMSLTRPGQIGEKGAGGRVRPRGRWVAPVGVAVQATPVTFEPWPDIFPAIWSSMQTIAGAPYERKPQLYRRLSPIEHLRADSPPVLFLEAECEHMFPLELTRRFIAKAKALGVRARYRLYTRAEHGFLYDVTRRQQREAFDDLLKFIKSLG